MRDGFDVDGAWALHPQVVVRRESFGALAYHFGTRRLTFLKSPVLRDVVESLDGRVSARAACASAGVGAEELPACVAALGALAASEMIVAREAV